MISDCDIQTEGSNINLTASLDGKELFTMQNPISTAVEEALMDQCRFYEREEQKEKDHNEVMRLVRKAIERLIPVVKAVNIKSKDHVYFPFTYKGGVGKIGYWTQRNMFSTVQFVDSEGLLIICHSMS